MLKNHDPTNSELNTDRICNEVISKTPKILVWKILDVVVVAPK